jgi:hypothetical protein
VISPSLMFHKQLFSERIGRLVSVARNEQVRYQSHLRGVFGTGYRASKKPTGIEALEVPVSGKAGRTQILSNRFIRTLARS